MLPFLTSTPATQPAPAASAAPQVPTQPPFPDNPFDPRLPIPSYSFSTYKKVAVATPQVATPPGLEEEPSPLAARTYRPRLHLWPTSRPAASDAIPLEPSTPEARTVPANVAPFAPMHTRSSSNKSSKSNNNNDDQEASEASKLKGVQWPGMDLFDAATPEMKRKRNQKKDTSIVDRLEKYALDVEPNEMIWTPTGSLWKERTISGQVDFDSSPYKLSALTPEPKKRKTSSRVTAKNSAIKTSTTKAKTTKTTTRATKRVPLAPKDANASLYRPATGQLGFPPPIPLFGVVNSAAPVKSPKKRKRKIEVFDDRVQQVQEQPFGNPTDMRTLTSEFYHNNTQAQQPGPYAAPHALEGTFAPFYQPAMQQGYFANTFNPMRQAAFYGFPYYAPYNHVGYDLPGFFSYPPPRPPVLTTQPNQHNEVDHKIEESEDTEDALFASTQEDVENNDSQSCEAKVLAQAQTAE